MKRQLGENIVDYIKSECERIAYGRVIIELNDNSDKIDVITEVRQRFNKK